MQQKSPGQGPPAAAALCRAKAPAKTRTEGQRSTRNNALPVPVPHSDPARRARPTLPQPLHCPPSPSSAPVLPGEPPLRGSAMYPARPDSDSTHIQADRGSSSVRLGFSPRSGSESGPLPSSFRTPPPPFSPHPAPRRARVHACGQKSPEAPGQNMKKGKRRQARRRLRLKKDEARKPQGGGRRTCGSAGGKSAQARTTPSGTNKRQE